MVTNKLRVIRNNGWKSVTLIFSDDADYLIRYECSKIIDEWTEDTRLERMGRQWQDKVHGRLIISAPLRGPRESGEAADRQYHGGRFFDGEW